MHEVIVVDNASYDRIGSIVSEFRRKGMPVTLVRKDVNLGFPRANNIAVELATGRYLLFLNPDTIVTKGTVERIPFIFQAHENVGAMQCLLLSYDNTNIIDSAGDFIDCFGEPLNRDQGLCNRGQHSSGEQIFSGRGAAVAVRRDVFERIGGFDSDFFAYNEDIDLGW